MSEELLIGLCFASIISCVSYASKLLTLSGSIAQFLLGFLLMGLGGWQWTLPILTFFLTSSAASRTGKKLRPSIEDSFEKSSTRDAWQVTANGGLAGATLLVWFFTRDDSSYLAHLGAVAAATADTWGTEIGVLSRKPPFLITSLQRVDSGRSGAISALGVAAGVIGSMTIWCSSLFWLSPDMISLISVLVGGMSGTFIDSIVGAVLQSQYKCNVCNKITERPIHCHTQSTKVSGWPWMKNDQVNFICTFVGSLACWVTWQLVNS